MFCKYFKISYLKLIFFTYARISLIGAKEKESGLVEDDVYVKRMCCYIKVCFACYACLKSLVLTNSCKTSKFLRYKPFSSKVFNFLL